MLDDHRAALDTFAERAREELGIRALVLTGSVARDEAREDSDLDVYLVVDEGEYELRRAHQELSHFELCGYPGGYVDGKVISRSMLELAAERGSEPMRASFLGAKVVYDDLGGVGAILERIPVYPEERRSQNMADFYAHFAIFASYFGPQAVKGADPFMRSYASSLTALFAGRLLLSYNRVLFPCAKQLSRAVSSCASLPPEFVPRVEALLTSPSEERFLDLLACVGAFADWGVPHAAVLTRFMDVDEWTWTRREPDLLNR